MGRERRRKWWRSRRGRRGRLLAVRCVLSPCCPPATSTSVALATSCVAVVGHRYRLAPPSVVSLSWPRELSVWSKCSGRGWRRGGGGGRSRGGGSGAGRRRNKTEGGLE